MTIFILEGMPECCYVCPVAYVDEDGELIRQCGATGEPCPNGVCPPDDCPLIDIPEGKGFDDGCHARPALK